MTATAVWPIQVAVVTALEAITMLAGDKVYQEGSVPRKAALPYIVLGAWTEPEDERYYKQPGRDQEGFIRCWGTDKAQALAVYAEAVLKLDGVTLTVTGHRMVRGKLGMVTDFAEPDPEVRGHVVIARYRSQTLVAA